VVREAFRTHPFVRESGSTFPSPRYPGLSSISEPFGDPLPDPPEGTEKITFTIEDLPAVRLIARLRADAYGLDDERREGFALALNEIVTNSLRHGGGAGTLLVWSDEDSLHAEVRDNGSLVPALAGRMRPTFTQDGGLGLWIANQMCDLVQIRTHEDGSVVRLRMSRR
jgi:anti-sigma regulatory factor (Ser/Thr protein kinase)